jgi:hypothetical protein
MGLPVGWGLKTIWLGAARGMRHTVTAQPFDHGSTQTTKSVRRAVIGPKVDFHIDLPIGINQLFEFQLHHSVSQDLNTQSWNLATFKMITADRLGVR